MKAAERSAAFFIDTRTSRAITKKKKPTIRVVSSSAWAVRRVGAKLICCMNPSVRVAGVIRRERRVEIGDGTPDAGVFAHVR